MKQTEHICWRWAAPIPTSPSTLRCSPLHPGDSSFHRQRSKLFSRAVDHCDTSCGPTQGDGRLWGSPVKCSAPKDHGVFMALRVVRAQTPRDEHLTGVDDWRRSQETDFSLFALLVGYKINSIGESDKLTNNKITHKNPFGFFLKIAIKRLHLLL